MSILFYAGLPRQPRAMTAVRVSQSGSTAMPAWSSSGKLLARSNAGRVFIYDLSKYIYNDPRQTKPVLAADIETPGVARMSWSADDEEILIEVNTYDLFSPSMLINIGSEELLTIQPAGSPDLTHMFWLGPDILGAVSPALGIDTADRLLVMNRKGTRPRDYSTFLQSKVLPLKASSLTEIDSGMTDEIVFGPLIEGRLLLGIRREHSGERGLVALNVASGRVSLLADGVDEISATDDGDAVVSINGKIHHAAIGAGELILGLELDFVDPLGRPLRATKASISPTGDFVAFESADPGNPGTYVARLP